MDLSLKWPLWIQNWGFQSLIHCLFSIPALFKPPASTLPPPPAMECRMAPGERGTAVWLSVLQKASKWQVACGPLGLLSPLLPLHPYFLHSFFPQRPRKLLLLLVGTPRFPASCSSRAGSGPRLTWVLKAEGRYRCSHSFCILTRPRLVWLLDWEPGSQSHTAWEMRKCQAGILCPNQLSFYLQNRQWPTLDFLESSQHSRR